MYLLKIHAADEKMIKFASEHFLNKIENFIPIKIYMKKAMKGMVVSIVEGWDILKGIVVS